jgi:Protein of unknown function (DUF1097)
MERLTELALSVGVLVAVFAKVGGMIGVLWYVGVLGWACFIAAGGKFNGVKRAAGAGLAGMFFAAAAEATALMSGHMELEWLFLGIAAFLTVIQSKLSWFSFIPAGLVGIAVIGAGGPVGIFDAVTNVRLVIVFVLGTVIGYVAERAAGIRMALKGAKKA